MTVSKSEEFLLELSRKSFLRLWSFPNLWQKKKGQNSGRELIDLLVIFENFIILFSDKEYKVSDHEDIRTVWNRWYKSAVDKNIDQINGAERFIRDRLGEVFMDSTFSVKFPFDIKAESVRFIRICVAKKPKDADQNPFKKIGVLNSLKDNCKVGWVGFNLGKYGPVHVLDENSLNDILENLDTVVDFIEYFIRKEEFFSEAHVSAHSESDLLAIYLKSDDESYEREFPICEALDVPDGLWRDFIASNTYSNWIKSKEHSYIVDRIIDIIGENLLDHKISVGARNDYEYHEAGLRILARESRFSRRFISTALFDILTENDQKTFWHCSIQSQAYPDTMICWMTYPSAPDEIDLEMVENCILQELKRYIMEAAVKFPEYSQFVGVGLPNPECAMKSVFVVATKDRSEMQLDGVAIERLGNITSTTRAYVEFPDDDLLEGPIIDKRDW